MPINVFGNSSNNDNKSLLIQKSYLRSNYIESDIDQDIDLKNQYRITNSPNPVNNNDIVNKLYIDTKIIDFIKKNIQNDDYVSFIDNDNIEYRLEKYIPKITLTTESLFNTSSGASSSSSWDCFSQSGNIDQIVLGLNNPTPLNWRSGPGVLYQNLPYISFHTHFLAQKNYAEISRLDIHNITKIELVINRFSLDNIMGELTILYKNSNDKWIELHKTDENENITARNEWDTLSLSISEKNYGVCIRHNKRNSINQIFSIAKITLTYTI